MTARPVTIAPFFWTIDDVQTWVRKYPVDAQLILEAEYKRHGGPRYSLIQWLKRHRLHNPTVRTIHNAGKP